jgi:hypothetical protein
MGIGIPALAICTTQKITYPPEMPVLVSPQNDSTINDSIIELAWSAQDPDSGDELIYTLFLDIMDPPIALIFQGQKYTTYRPYNLLPDNQYFWKIRVSDGKYVVEGPVWTFRTPPKLEDPQPAVLAKVTSKPRTDVVYIPAGSFVRSDGETITLSPFYMHKFEVSQKKYHEVTGENPSYRQSDSLPVEKVNWEEAVAFCREEGGRLPTEAEWEYAARAGTQSDYYWGEDDIKKYAWYFENSDKHTQPVGRKKPNAWGLFDMSGNVFEWVRDWHASYLKSILTDPQGAESGNAKVTRGGSWYSDASSLKSGARFKNRPGFSSYKLGFRCVFPIEKPKSLD